MNRTSSPWSSMTFSILSWRPDLHTGHTHTCPHLQTLGTKISGTPCQTSTLPTLTLPHQSLYLFPQDDPVLCRPLELFMLPFPHLHMLVVAISWKAQFYWTCLPSPSPSLHTQKTSSSGSRKKFFLLCFARKTRKTPFKSGRPTSRHRNSLTKKAIAQRLKCSGKCS